MSLSKTAQRRFLAVFVPLMLLGGVARAQGTGYIYAYFKGPWPDGGHSGVYLSYSPDGLQFDSMNNDQPVFVPPAAWSDAEDQTRDPSVVYGPDGRFHMVWTSGISTKTIGYASSANLKDWTDPQLVEVWGPRVTVDHTWAPEILYDEIAEHYQIVFASNLDNDDHKLYSITTDDFSTYTAPSVFYYNNATVIDAMIARDVAGGQYLMPIKDEQNGQKNIRLATGPTAAGPWTTDNPVIVGPTSGIEPNATEGPSIIKIGDTWHLYYDAYGAGYLGVATSDDPTDPSSWVNRTAESTMPVGPNAHHGTVFAAPLAGIAFDLLPFSRSDLTDDGVLDASDWLQFNANHLADLSGQSGAQQALAGDLDGDGDNDYDDFALFKRDYNAYYGGAGTGAFAAMLRSLAIPEPTTLVLALFAAAGVLGTGRSARVLG
ncbi:glycoside hydrolase family 43 protein [Botrimarina colliarenosi]|uniref:glycoside hydrolase family 43 protein n=1 Tax=Botrimarina colliarenosi TaxID=2528001 RepID=UPI0018D4B0C3|nr:glycoside hydrolase family 43 protein [Botrimarina colliarenosi]